MHKVNHTKSSSYHLHDVAITLLHPLWSIPPHTLTHPALLQAIEPSKENIIIAKEEQEHLQKLISNLPYFLKEVIILHYYKNLSVHSIAALLNLPHQIVTTRLAHSIYWLKIFVVKRKPPE